MSSQLKLTGYGALATMAAAVSLLSVFSTTAWIGPVMFAVFLVAATCALVRWSPLPAAFEPIAAALVILIWVTILDARSKAHFGVIPGRLAFRHLGNVARNGFTEIHHQPTPAPPHHGVVLLTVVGVAAIALVVDLLTVTLRRAALAGLPLLALFTVAAATGHHGVGIFAFIVGAIGYLWLLYADNRDKVARWGAAVGTGKRARPASAWSTDASSAPAPASLGRQVGAVAISLGLIIPFFIPGLHTGINKHGSGGPGGSGGGGSVRTFDPLVRVGADLSKSVAEPVLSYRTTAADPSYLRMTSLDVFNGSSFTLPQLTASANSDASETLPVTPPQGPIVNTSITVSRSFDVRWLPVVATTLGVSVNNNWRYDPGTATIFSATTDTRGLRYTTRSVVNSPTPAQLADAPAPDHQHDADMALSGISPAVTALTHRVTRGATSRYQAAVDIQRFFTSGKFKYDTNIPPDHSSHALDDFLLRTRKGFCQQFSAAMAVMARLAGIPSRVAVGFTRGHEQNGTWTVTTHDAHAWPELWFQGFGWLPFEPTPRGDGQAVTPSYAKASTGGGSPPTTKQQGGKANGQPKVPAGLVPKSGTGHGRTGGPGASPVGSTGSPAGSRTGMIAWIVLLIVALALVVPGVARAVIRQRRWRELGDPGRAPGAAWAELRDSAIDLRAPWDERRSPRQVATALLAAIEATPGTRESMTRVVRCEERSRYAPAAGAPDDDLRRDVTEVRSALAESRSRRQRILATAMPRSVLQSVRAVGSRLANRAEARNRDRVPIRVRLRRLGTARS